MVDSFTIRNFRTFNDVKVDDCRRINILVGDSGSGKTALLEAIFLAAGVTPELALRTRSWRGSQGRMTGSHEDLHQALWADLFFKFKTNQSAVISLKGAAEQTRSVAVSLNPRGKVRAVPPPRNKPGAPVRVVPVRSPIEFKWQIRGFPDVSVKPYFEGENLIFPPTPDSYVRAVFFAASRTGPELEIAGRFSKLSKDFESREFIEIFTRLFPRIKDLSVELSAGTPELFASVDGLPRKIPLSLASGGMNKLAGILLGITDQRGGIIIVDEIENGFYYQRMPAVWEALLEFSRMYESQIFVSTHSNECLKAVVPLVEKNPDDFCMLRTVLGPDGTQIKYFDALRFANAIADNVEVR